MLALFYNSPRSFLRQLWRRGRRDILVLLVLLLCAEALLRLLRPELAHDLYDRSHTGGYPIAINEEGYRGPAIPREKAAGTFRLLAVGDSTTFGTGAAWSDTWPHAMGRGLAEASGFPVEVMNVGFPGTSLASLRSEFETKWAHYEPDLVVLALSVNMPALAWIQGEKVPPVKREAYAPRDATWLRQFKRSQKRILAAFALPSFLRQESQRWLYRAGLARHEVDPEAPYGPMLALGWQQSDLPAVYSEQAWEKIEVELLKWNNTLEGFGVPWLLTYTPTRFMLSNEASDNEKSIPLERLKIDPEQQIARMAQDHGLPYVSVRKRLLHAREQERTLGRDGDLYIPFDFTHLDAVGHQAVADALLEKR